MSPLARRGFDVFMGKGKCGTCHFAPLFNGTVPPAYTKAELEVIGVPRAARLRALLPGLDPRVAIVVAGAPTLRARLSTPRGEVELPPLGAATPPA